MVEQKRNQFGLTVRDMTTIQSIFESYPEVETVLIFGSRAKGNYKLGSDVDLAIMNEGVSIKRMAQLRSDFEESSLPYVIDLVHFPKVDHQEFIDHISRVGAPFYKKSEKAEIT